MGAAVRCKAPAFFALHQATKVKPHYLKQRFMAAWKLQSC